eukprot:404000_1
MARYHLRSFRRRASATATSSSGRTLPSSRHSAIPSDQPGQLWFAAGDPVRDQHSSKRVYPAAGSSACSSIGALYNQPQQGPSTKRAPGTVRHSQRLSHFGRSSDFSRSAEPLAGHCSRTELSVGGAAQQQLPPEGHGVRIVPAILSKRSGPPT